MTREELLKEGFSEGLLNRAVKTYRDLQVQAMLFNMDIDIETWSLVPKSDYKHPFWVTRWREKLSQSDYTPDGSDEQEYGEDR